MHATLRRCPLLKALTSCNSYFEEVFYRMERILLQQGEPLVVVGETHQGCYIVMRGMLEAHINLEGHEFVLERVQQGCVINSRCLFGSGEE